MKKISCCNLFPVTPLFSYLDSTIRELLLRHEQGKKAPARKHKEELASFHVQRKLLRSNHIRNHHRLQRQEATESPNRTPSPVARSSLDHTEGSGFPGFPIGVQRPRSWRGCECSPHVPRELLSVAFTCRFVES
jgi:hypothetical protein